MTERATRRLNVASITRVLPIPTDPSQGVFVANRLRALGDLVDVRVVQPVPYFPVIRPLPSWVKDQQGERFYRVPMFYLPGVMKCADGRFLERAITRVVERWTRAGNVDLLDAHFGYPDGAGVVRLGRRLGVPTVVTLRGVENELLRKPTIRPQLRSAMRNADACICVSHFMARLARDAGVSEDKIAVIHNAIDREQFSPGLRGQSRMKLGLDPHRPVVVSVGHLTERKGHHLLIEAIASTPGLRDAYLLIIGRPTDRAYERRLNHLVQEHSLRSRVVILKDVAPEEVVHYLRAADVFGLMSRREGCCNALLEALACGTPVVATDVGDNAHFVVHGHNGYIVERSAPAAGSSLLEAISRSWNSNQISTSLRVGSWGAVAQQVKHVFDYVLAGNGTLPLSESYPKHPSVDVPG